MIGSACARVRMNLFVQDVCDSVVGRHEWKDSLDPTDEAQKSCHEKEDANDAKRMKAIQHREPVKWSGQAGLDRRFFLLSWVAWLSGSGHDGFIILASPHRLAETLTLTGTLTVAGANCTSQVTADDSCCRKSDKTKLKAVLAPAVRQPAVRIEDDTLSVHFQPASGMIKSHHDVLRQAARIDKHPIKTVWLAFCCHEQTSQLSKWKWFPCFACLARTKPHQTIDFSPCRRNLFKAL